MKILILTMLVMTIAALAHLGGPLAIEPKLRKRSGGRWSGLSANARTSMVSHMDVNLISNMEERVMMKKTIALAAVTMIAAAAIAAPSPAEARGGRIAAGIIGGIAAGAIIGGALSSPYYYPPGPVYYGYGPYYYGPRCYWRRVWTPVGPQSERVCY